MADPTPRRTGAFGREFLTSLTQRLNGPAFLGRFLKVQQRGNRHFAVCPFHKDSKPSMLIRDDGSFHCFGCHQHGSVFNFLMERNAVSFPEAVAEVAQFAGVALPERSGARGPTKEQQAMFDALENCAAFFENHLGHATQGSPIKRYLEFRDINQATIDKYRIGYAPNAWTSVKDRFRDISEQLLIDADLLVRNEEKQRIYDRFRDRLMFPIRNRSGAVVGFGGRVLDDQVEPKYLNTKQTKVFSKGRELYGLYEALQAVRRPARLLLVEGYMDVVALSQQGIGYAVAALGTASNADHFRTMFWFTDEVICCFDGDDAGRTAARRALESALSALADGKSIRFMFLPTDEDPDSFVRAHGAEAFEREVKSAQHAADYFVEMLTENKDRSFNSIEAKARFVDRATALIQKVSQPSMRKVLAQEVANCFPDSVNMQALLEPSDPPPDWESPPELDDERAELVEHEQRTPTSAYENVTTKLRVSQLLCAPGIWPLLREHHELLERLVNSARDHPLTRVWLAIDQHGFSDVQGLIASFQGSQVEEDKYLMMFLSDIYDEKHAKAMSDIDSVLPQFLDGVETFITTLEKRVHREVKLAQIVEGRS